MRLRIELDPLQEPANKTKMGFITGSGTEMLVYIMWANNGGFMWLDDLLGFGGNRVQLLQWMISLISDSSWDTGAGTIPRPGIKGLSGVIPAIIPRLGSKSECKKRSELISTEYSVENHNTYNKTGLLQVTRSCLFTDSSVLVTHTQHTHERLHSRSWINHLVNNMHILRSSQGWVIVSLVLFG